MDPGMKTDADGIHPPILDNFESITCKDVEHEFGGIPVDAWTSIDDNTSFPKEKVHREGEQVGIARCIGIVQTTPERLLAWFFTVDLDYDHAKHVKGNGPNADLYPNITVAMLNDHHKIYYSCRKLPFPLVARDWLQRSIYKEIDNEEMGGYLLAYQHIDEAKTDVPPFTPSTLKVDEKRVRGEYVASEERSEAKQRIARTKKTQASERVKRARLSNTRRGNRTSLRSPRRGHYMDNIRSFEFLFVMLRFFWRWTK